MMRRVLNTARAARRVSEPGQALIESKLAEWRRAAEGPGAQAPIGAAELTETLGSMLPQQRAELVVANLAEATLRIAAADDPAQLAVLTTPVKRSLQQLEEHITGFPPKLRALAQEQFKTFEAGLLGPRGLIAGRGLELAALERAQSILSENAAISARLTAAVDGLVGEARGEMTAATADAASVQRASSRVLIAVVLLSLLSSGLIVWLYVQRDLLRRLTALSGSMLAVAGGNLRVPLPAPGRDDEIADMTRALTVFRDTAVEIENQGLREIAKARQRLRGRDREHLRGLRFVRPRRPAGPVQQPLSRPALSRHRRRDGAGHAVRDHHPARRRAGSRGRGKRPGRGMGDRAFGSPPRGERARGAAPQPGSLDPDQRAQDHG